MSGDLVLLDIDPRGVATATLNRPEVGNAYNAALLIALIDGLGGLASDDRRGIAHKQRQSCVRRRKGF